MIAEDLSFEDAFARLEEMVQTLERGELTLAEMVATYEQALRLCEHCSRLLDAAELRVSQLAQAADGTLEVVPLDLRGLSAQNEAREG